MDGILNIDKPWGKTSYSIVAMVKRLSGERRVGHAGTLDPAATGVLPVCLGKGTRLAEFFMDAGKTYRARIELGITTDTYDASGEITQEKDPSGIDLEQMETALASFRGTIQQTPPMYSAVKHAGQPLYKLARAGIKVERKSRSAKIYRLEITDWQPPVATIEVECGKGTYIRSLAHDLGQLLGCGAHLKSLVRSKCGLFDISNAVSVPQLEDAFRYGYWATLVYPIDIMLLQWQAIIVNDDTEDSIKKGQPLVLENQANDEQSVNRDQYNPIPPTGENHCRAYTLDGNFLSILHFNRERGQWQPEKVFL